MKKNQLNRDNWHLNNIIHNFIIDYEEYLIGKGIDLYTFREALKLSEQINKMEEKK